MPDPILANSGSSTAQSSCIDAANSCDPAIASCPAAPASPNAARPHVEPGYDVNLGSGSAAGELVRRYDAAAPSSCRDEAYNASNTCMRAASAAGGALASAPSGVGLVLDSIAALGLTVQCARDISSYLACGEESERRAEIDSDCTARGGITLLGIHSELVCLVTP